MPFVHLTAHLFHSQRGRLEADNAAWLWAHLRPAFPNALAAVLMPNHPHLVARVADVSRAVESFTKVLGALARRVKGPRPIWEPIPKPKILSPNKLVGEMAYVLLNPTHAGIVSDPLAWLFSTHLDVVGAVADPWVTFDALLPYMPSSIRTAEQLHAFVSDDRSVARRGAPFPTPAKDTAMASRTLDEILRAAVVATRGGVDDHRRRGPTRDVFVSLATRQGWTDAHRLATLCGVTTETVRAIQRAAPPSALEAARLCLGDRRLLDAAGPLFDWASAPTFDRPRSPSERSSSSSSDRPLSALQLGRSSSSPSDRPLSEPRLARSSSSPSDRPLSEPRLARSSRSPSDRPLSELQSGRTSSDAASAVERAAHRRDDGGR